MNEIKKDFYNLEKDSTEQYTERWIIEKCTVKDINDLLVNHHYWEDSDGELWADFDKPMENVKADFDAYRNRKGFMKPTSIKKLRNNLDLTVMEFAELTGLGYSNISQIENNQRVQTKYQDIMFKLLKAQYDATGEITTTENTVDLTDTLNKDLLNTEYFDSNLFSNDENDSYESDFSLKKDKTLGDAA